METYRHDFGKRGMSVTLNKRVSAGGTHRWLEFIDRNKMPDYVSMYDISNMGGTEVKTMFTSLHFPLGVYVEQLKNWKGRQELKDKIPPELAEFLQEKNARDDYDAMVEAVCATDPGFWKNFEAKKLLPIVQEYRPKFEAKGIKVFLSVKQEKYWNGSGQSVVFFRWLEFVDMAKQPNYQPQRDAEVKDEDKCVIS